MNARFKAEVLVTLDFIPMAFPEPDQVDLYLFHAFLQTPKISLGPPRWHKILIPEFPPEKF